MFIILITFIGIQTNVVESKFSLDLERITWDEYMTFHHQIIKYTYTLSESITFLKGQRIRLGNHRDNIDNFRELLEDDNINRFQPIMKK